MPDDPRILYWDSCLFLDYINSNPDHIHVIEDVLQQVQDTDGSKILTSVVAKVEVAHATQERVRGVLDPQVEADIDALWDDSSVVELIEFNDEIALMARRLMREAIQREWGKLTTMDAIHLASAKWVGIVTEFHTYDERLHRYSPLVGCAVREPYAQRPRLL